MEIKKCEIPIKCDVNGCNNTAKYTLQFKKRVLASNMYFCENCLKELYCDLGKIFVPKSPQNFMKKKIKEGENNGQ